MMCGHCGGNKTRLCPISLGIALGVTSALAVLIWFGWMMYYGVPANMAEHIGALTWSNAGWHALWALIKGFLFGVVVALIYDLIACICKGMCCRHKADTCACQCHMGARKDIPERRDVL